MTTTDIETIANGLAIELAERLGVKPKVIVCSYYHFKYGQLDSFLVLFGIIPSTISVTVTQERLILSVPSDAAKYYNVPIAASNNRTFNVDVTIDNNTGKTVFDLADPTSIDKLIAKIDSFMVAYPNWQRNMT